MENASKALLIAGAILLVILLISLGMMVYTNAKGAIDNTNLDAEAARTFNTKITQYCGKKKSATDINNLMDAVSASNGAQNKITGTERHLIAVEVDSNIDGDYYTGGSINVVSATGTETGNTLDSRNYPSFSAGITYQATYETDADGYVNKVTIIKQST